jgi:hypothetical protein
MRADMAVDDSYDRAAAKLQLATFRQADIEPRSLLPHAGR